MATAGMSRSSLIRVRSVLGQALDTAQRRGKVARNVARLAEMPATTAPTARRSLTTEQAAQLLDAARGDRLEALYLTALMLGLRPGEVTGLRWDDLDGDPAQHRGSLKMSERAPGSYDLGPTKTPRSRRSLRVPPPVAVGSQGTPENAEDREARRRARVDRHRPHLHDDPSGPRSTPPTFATPSRKLTERAQASDTGRSTSSATPPPRCSPRPASPWRSSPTCSATRPRGCSSSTTGTATRPVIDAHVAVMTDLFGASRPG